MERAARLLLLLATLAGRASGGSFCPPGWHMFDRSCFRWSADRKTWHQAQDACALLNASLGTINTADEHEFLAERSLSEAFWIGLHIERPRSGFRWDDANKSKPVFSNWAAEEPNSGTQNCVYLSHYHSGAIGGWTDHLCLKEFPFICEKVKRWRPCRHGWTSQLDKCYLLNGTDTRDWFSARAHCRRMGGDLVVIESSAENHYLSAQINRNGGQAWIGLWDQHLDSRWRWLDQPGEPVYTNWLSGQPINTKQGLSKHCACGMPYHGRLDKWNTDACITFYKYICEAPATNGSCPTPWESRTHKDGASCYYFSSNVASWVDARARCRQLMTGVSADLVQIETSNEMDFLSEFVQEWSHHDFCYWIGLNDHTLHGTWSWLDRTNPAIFTNWYVTPTPTPGEDCVIVHATSRLMGTWTNVGCKRQFGYICEMEGVPCLDSNETLVLPHGGHCYRLSPPSVTTVWEDARRACHLDVAGRTTAAYLVNIDTQTEMDFLKGMINVQDDVAGFWIGLRRRDRPGPFMWSHKVALHTVQYSNWAPGRPDEGRSEDCVVLLESSWFDRDCLSRQLYVCQRHALGSYSYYDFALGDFVYKAVTSERAPRRSDFAELCSNLLGSGADLAVLHTQEEFRLVGEELSHRDFLHGGSLWVEASDSFQTGKQTRERCLALEVRTDIKFRLGSDFCCQPKSFLCKRHLNSSAQDFDFMYNNAMYKLVTDAKSSYAGAEKACREVLGATPGKGHLADVTSELDVVSAEIRARHSGENVNYWISGPPASSIPKYGECPVLTYPRYPDVEWEGTPLEVRDAHCTTPNNFICKKHLTQRAAVRSGIDEFRRVIFDVNKHRTTFINVIHQHMSDLTLSLAICMPFVAALCFILGFMGVAAAYRWTCYPVTKWIYRNRKHNDVIYLRADEV